MRVRRRSPIRGRPRARSRCSVTKEALRRLQAKFAAENIDDLIRLAYGSADFREGMGAFLEQTSAALDGDLKAAP